MGTAQFTVSVTFSLLNVGSNKKLGSQIESQSRI